MNKLKLLSILFGMIYTAFSECINVTLQDVKGKQYPLTGIPSNCPGCAFSHMKDVKEVFKKKYGFDAKYIRLINQNEIFKQLDGTYRKVLPENYLFMGGTYEVVDQAPTVDEKDYKDQKKIIWSRKRWRK